jgi:hypothetical protein
MTSEPADLIRPVGEPLILPAIPKFVAQDAFTEANGIAVMSAEFKQRILPLVEEGVPAKTIRVSDLTRDARNARIYTALDVDERGELSPAHLFHLLVAQSKGEPGPLRVGDGRTVYYTNAAFIIGADSNTCIVTAALFDKGWTMYASPLGERSTWRVGARFFSYCS